MDGNNTLSDINIETERTKLESELTDVFEEFMTSRGGTVLHGRLYSLFLIKQKEELNYQDFNIKFKDRDKSTISRNLKELERWRLIKKDRKHESEGKRKVLYYSLEKDSLFQLLSYAVKNNTNYLKDTREDLIRIRSHFEDSKDGFTMKTIDTINFFIEWIDIFRSETDIFLTKLNESFVDLEKKYQRY